MTSKVTTVTTPDLRVGDVVHVYGLLVQVVEALHQTRHPVDRNGPTWATQAVITNPEYLATDAGRYLFGGILPRGATTWTIQGNVLATWGVSR